MGLRSRLRDWLGNPFGGIVAVAGGLLLDKTGRALLKANGHAATGDGAGNVGCTCCPGSTPSCFSAVAGSVCPPDGMAAATGRATFSGVQIASGCVRGPFSYDCRNPPNQQTWRATGSLGTYCCTGAAYTSGWSWSYGPAGISIQEGSPVLSCTSWGPVESDAVVLITKPNATQAEVIVGDQAGFVGGAWDSVGVAMLFFYSVVNLTNCTTAFDAANQLTATGVCQTITRPAGLTPFNAFVMGKGGSCLVEWCC